MEKTHSSRGGRERHEQGRFLIHGLLLAVTWSGTMVLMAPEGYMLQGTLFVAVCAAFVHLALSSHSRGVRFAGTRTYQTSQGWIGSLGGVFIAILLFRVLRAGTDSTGSFWGTLETKWGLLQLGSAAIVSALALAIMLEFEIRLSQNHAPTQRAVIIGTGEEAAEWITLLDDHPELGVELVGCIGDGEFASRTGIADRWLGPTGDLLDILEREHIDLPIVAVTSFRRPTLQKVVDTLVDAEHDIAMSWGVGRLSSTRLSARTFSHETLPIVRAHRPSRLALLSKRAMDATLAAIILTIASPVVLITALIVKLDSKGPAFFKQQRVGLNGETFEMIKLRSMRTDAEDELAKLMEDNERNGPLFKMERDPRVTRVGHFLRASSLDEIPQLFNVLKGEMSLVGPRPALPDETASFDTELQGRSGVRPGITGLWQLEARANKSFDAYKRLDLHYLENWSLSLDLRIMIATAQMLGLGVVVSPLAGKIRKRRGEVTEVDVSLDDIDKAAEEAEPEEERTERVAVLGAGLVGLTQALGLVELGHEVVCADIDSTRVIELQTGIPPAPEEGIEHLLAEGNASGRLTFTNDPIAAVDGVDFVFLCVAAPEGPSGEADVSYLETAARQIGPALSPGAVVVIKSTVPVGSTSLVTDRLGRTDVAVVSNPEFLREGSAVQDWRAPDRIIVGGREEAAHRVMALYHGLSGKRIICDAPSAELMKYASNAYLATRLTFVNSLSEVCESVGADVITVTSAMGLDRRIGSAYLEPGPGWGGSDIRKDVNALVFQAEEVGADFSQLRATISANDAHVSRAGDLIMRRLPTGERPVVGVLGLSFKAGTGDTNESPAIKIIERLLKRDVEVRAFDPCVVGSPVEGVIVANSTVECAEGAHVLAVLTDWPEFADLDYEAIADAMVESVLIDMRHVIDAKQATAAGFELIRPGVPSGVADGPVTENLVDRT